MGRRERGAGRTASDKAKVDRAATPEGRGKEMRRHQRKDDDNNKRKIHHTQRLTTTRTKCRPKGMRWAAEAAEAAARRKSRLSLAVVWRLAVWRLVVVVVVVAGAWRRLLLLPRSGSQPLARSASRLGETAGKDEEGQKG